MTDQTEQEETEEQAKDKEGLFALEDVTVDTLGLVEAGAVGETFFLLKNRGEPMPDEVQGLDLTDVEEELQGATFLERIGFQRIKDLLAKGRAAEQAEEQLKQSNPEEADEETATQPPDADGERVATNKGNDKKKPKRQMHKNLSAGAARGVRSLLSAYGEDLPSNVAGMLAALLEDSDALDDGGEETNTEKKDDEVTTMSKGTEDVKQPVEDNTPQAEETPVEGAAPVVKNEELEAVLARLEKSEKANETILARLEKSEEQLAKAKLAAAQERNARELIVYIEKAREINALSVNADELGSFLHTLAKVDETANIEKAEDAEDRSDLVGYITGVLKAANEQAVQAGFFKEAGTSQMPDDNGEMDLVTKAKVAVEKGEYPDYKTALLAVSQEEADAYRGQFDN